MSAFGGKADMPQCPLFSQKRTFELNVRNLCSKRSSLNGLKENGPVETC
jgi:hypothetical protein